MSLLYFLFHSNSYLIEFPQGSFEISHTGLWSLNGHHGINTNLSKYHNLQMKSTHEGLEKFPFNPETLLFCLTSPVPSSLSFFSFSLPHTQPQHIKFCYQFKAQREVSEGACQSDKLSPKWWQIGRLSARLAIKSRPGFHARTVPENGDRWHSGEAHSPLAYSLTQSALCLCHIDLRAA